MKNPIELMATHPDKVAHFSVGVVVYAVFHFLNPIIGLLCVALVAFGKRCTIMCIEISIPLSGWIL